MVRSGLWRTRLEGGVVVAVGMVAAACNLVSGADAYENVSRCTGSMCGVCPQGERWEPVSETCLAECRQNTTPCGPTCCAQGQNCIGDVSGAQRCSPCDTLECGTSCCELGATCIDSQIGVCSATYGATKQSCPDRLDCGERQYVDGYVTGTTSCCESIHVPGGAFFQGSKSSFNETPEREVTVESFELDKFEVTTGRFFLFVSWWFDQDGLPGGAAAHPKIADSGWRTT